jgi:hypothetical protein
LESPVPVIPLSDEFVAAKTVNQKPHRCSLIARSNNILKIFCETK